MTTDLQVVQWPIEKLIPYARNARTHSEEQVMQIAASIVEFGWTNPILVGAEGVIIAGHARVLAARKLQMTEVPVIVLTHLSETQRRALVLADNKLAMNAGWDEEMLRVEIESLQEDGFNLDLVGFSDVELGAILSEEPEFEGNADENAVPEEPAVAVTRPGDVWIMGEHRLLCGDATKMADVECVMAGDVADLVFSDPPFNVNVEGYTKDRLTIQNDNMSPEAFRGFLAASFQCYRAIVKPGASMYICHSSSWQREFQNALEAAGFSVRCQIVWGKNTFAWGFGRYKFQHEPIFYCHVAGQKDVWYGDKSQSTLWQEDKPAANRLHPTMKPVELIERAILNSSKGGDLVADFFGGAGSTLIACERKGRKARLIEIDPKYADCTVTRWQDFTGKAAVLQGDGRTFAQVAAERRKGIA